MEARFEALKARLQTEIDALRIGADKLAAGTLTTARVDPSTGERTDTSTVTLADYRRSIAGLEDAIMIMDRDLGS